mmetsp:Transcript_31663/g.76647  ORF Transcript_31663/g.76647 Transcript_31663/m.76647 type:complete len:219 (+) Transcript_31663:2165-2821(+)
MTPMEAVAENLAQLPAFFIQSKLSLKKSSFVVPQFKYPCAVTAQLCNTEFLLMLRSSNALFRFAMTSPSEFEFLYRKLSDSSDVNPPVRTLRALSKCSCANADPPRGSTTSTERSFAAAPGGEALPPASTSTAPVASAADPSTTADDVEDGGEEVRPGSRDATPATKCRSPESTTSKQSCRPSSAESSSAEGPPGSQAAPSSMRRTTMSPTASASPRS